MKLKDIHRSLYYEFDSMILISKDKHGDDVDKILTRALQKLKADGRLDKINEKVHKSYIDWQPYKDNF